MMISQQSWPQVQSKVHERWNRISDDDCKSIAGNRDQLVSKIQKTYSVSREDAERQVREFEQGSEESGQQAGQKSGSTQRQGEPSRQPQGAGRSTESESRPTGGQPSRESRGRENREGGGSEGKTQQAAE